MPRKSKNSPLPCLEICAGAGGQALGLEGAGFEPEALVEIERPCQETLRFNPAKLERFRRRTIRCDEIQWASL